MAKKIKKITVPVLVIAFMQILSFLYAGYNNRITSPQKLQIKLKPMSLVVGNQIMLGEICDINTHDKETKNRISHITIDLAPPPGESIEITLISVKKKITLAGFAEYIPYVTGPKTIRVETAHREIEKAFLHEEFAINEILISVDGKKV